MFHQCSIKKQNWQFCNNRNRDSPELFSSTLKRETITVQTVVIQTYDCFINVQVSNTIGSFEQW